jgi:enamine deaminase RidA (YjgF/YER057c/UK114 family)
VRRRPTPFDLIAAGSSWEKGVKVNIYLKSMDDYAEMNKVYERVSTADAVRGNPALDAQIARSEFKGLYMVPPKRV